MVRCSFLDARLFLLRDAAAVRYLHRPVDVEILRVFRRYIGPNSTLFMGVRQIITRPCSRD
jgi:hypothetical protein